MAELMAGMGGERRQFWAEHIAAWKVSGQGKGAYCREQGLNASSFSRWSKKLGERPPGGDGPRLVPVRLSAPAPQGPGGELRLPRGWVLRIDGGADPVWVAQLARALSGPC
jgi:hypothetical protein